MFHKIHLRYFFPISFFVFSSFLLFSSLAGQEQKPKATYLEDSNRTGARSYDYGSTAPREYQSLSRVEEPKIQDLRLKFGSAIPGFYVGPDGGEVYIWKKNQYSWKRKDGSVFTEWENGNWRLDGYGVVLDSFFMNCSGCLPKLEWKWKDGTRIVKDWVPFRKDYSWVFQKLDTAPALNWQIIIPSKFRMNQSKVSIYELYYSSDWDLYVKGLQTSFKSKEFFDFMKREFNMENRGMVPVIMFSKTGEMSSYVGRKLVNDSEEGGFGGQDGVTLCCGEKQAQTTGNSVLDEDAKRRSNHMAFYHEAVHNITQMTCTSHKVTAGKLIQEIIPDHWFEEGIANYTAGQFVPSQRSYIYGELDKRIKERKIPKSFQELLKQGYKDLLPYTLGAYLVEYMHIKYGGNAVIDYHKDTCLGMDPSAALEKAVGMNPDRFLQAAVSDFQNKMVSLGQTDLKKQSIKGYTVMLPENQQDYDAFLSQGFSPPSSVMEIQNYEDVPAVKRIFQAKVGDFSKIREGDFDAPKEAVFYLWKNGTYKWYTPSWETVVFPGNQTVFQKDGWQIIEWEDGKRKVTSPDGTSVMFWSKEQKGYFDKSGKQIRI